MKDMFFAACGGRTAKRKKKLLSYGFEYYIILLYRV